MQKMPHQIKSNNIYVMMIAGYVGISGIYWFPGLPYNLITYSKTGLFCLIVLLAISRIKKIPNRLTLIFYGLISSTILIFISGLFRRDMAAAIVGTRVFALPLLWLVALSAVREREYQAMFRFLKVTLTGFFVLSLCPIAVKLGFLPDFPPPTELISENTNDLNYALELGSISGGGFAGQSTSWGIVVPVMALLMASIYSTRSYKPISEKLWLNLAMVLAVLSVAVTSARGGSIVLAAIWIYSAIRNKKSLLIGLAVISITFFLIFGSDLYGLLPENYFRGFELNGSGVVTLDSITTGRFSTFSYALEMFYSSPLVGVGEEKAKLMGLAIHNTFLRILAENGLIVFLPSMFVTFLIVRNLIAKRTRQRPIGVGEGYWPNTKLVIIAGLILANFEPGTIFGNFNATASFWTSVWVMLIGPSFSDKSDPGLELLKHKS